MNIAIPKMLVQLREQLHDDHIQIGWLESLAYKVWARSLRSAWMYGIGTWLVTRTLGRWKRRSGWLRRLPGPLHGWTEKRDFPAPAPERFRDWWEKEGRHES